MITSLFTLTALAASILAQNVTVPNYCTTGFTAGTDTVLYTTPYTYSQVLSIIGNYQNLTWSGNPIDTVTLNGTDNTVGTARTYNNSGAHVIETILTYSKPPDGPYNEVHNTALLTIPSINISFYIIYDGTTVTSTCSGAASAFNFTANFCATNASLAATVLHEIHLTDAETVGKFLGGKNYTGCAAVTGNASSTSSAPLAPFTGAASRFEVGTVAVWGVGVVGAFFL